MSKLTKPGLSKLDNLEETQFYPNFAYPYPN